MEQQPLSVTAVCPTYGRFARLQDAIACFILQDYAGNKQLSILNDAHIPLQLLPNGDNELAVNSSAKIVLTNVEERIPTLGQKRQMLAESVSTDLIAHWEDDDLYLPWHFSTLIPMLQARPEIDCIKPNRAFWATGPRNKLRAGHLYGNVYDGQMIYRRGTGINYSNRVRSVPRELLDDFYLRGKLELCTEMEYWDFSYVYRIQDGLRHLSKVGKENYPSARTQRIFAKKNRDYGEGEPLLPDNDFTAWAMEQLRDQFTRFAEGLKHVINEKTAGIMEQRILNSIQNQ